MNKWSRLLKSTIPAADRIIMTQQMLILVQYFYMRRCSKPKTISYRKQRDTDFTMLLIITAKSHKTCLRVLKHESKRIKPTD